MEYEYNHHSLLELQVKSIIYILNMLLLIKNNYIMYININIYEYQTARRPDSSDGYEIYNNNNTITKI